MINETKIRRIKIINNKIDKLFPLKDEKDTQELEILLKELDEFNEPIKFNQERLFNVFKNIYMPLANNELELNNINKEISELIKKREELIKEREKLIEKKNKHLNRERL